MNWPSGPTAAQTTCWKRLWTISWPTTIGLEARFETAWRQPVEARQFPTKRCAHGSNRKTAPEGCASTGRTVLPRICDRSPNTSSGIGVWKPPTVVSLVIYDAVQSLRIMPYRGRPGSIDDTRELVVRALPYIVVLPNIRGTAADSQHRSRRSKVAQLTAEAGLATYPAFR